MEQKQPIYQWLDVDGNNTLAVDYPLDENSWVIDLGGYHGVWASQMLEKYNSNIILIEPVPEFYAYLRNKFKGVSKVTVLNFGVSAERTSGTLFLRADGTSKYIETENPIIVQFLTLQDILDMAGKEHIDLLTNLALNLARFVNLLEVKQKELDTASREERLADIASCTTRGSCGAY